MSKSPPIRVTITLECPAMIKCCLNEYIDIFGKRHPKTYFSNYCPLSFEVENYNNSNIKLPGTGIGEVTYAKDLRILEKKNYTPSVPVCKHHLHLIKGCLDIGTEGVVGLTIFALGGVFLLCSSSKLNLGKFTL